MRPHRKWIVFVVVVTLASIGLYVASAIGTSRWPGGSSVPGMLFGTLGGLIILFEFLLWPRKAKWVRAWRIGKTQTWMRAHIWLGLLSVPFIWLHSGFTWGGNLSTTLAAMFIIVIASGVFGLAMQQVVPRLLLKFVPAETIYSQIKHVSREMVKDADALIVATCGKPGDSESIIMNRTVAFTAMNLDQSEYVMIGANREAGKIKGKVLQTQIPVQVVYNTALLKTTFEDTIRPFLRHGPRRGSPLNRLDQSRRLFEGLRSKLDPTAHYVIDSLETSCDSRRQFHKQAWLHWLLHSWLSIHLPLSIALVILMFLHIFVAIKYW